MSRWLLGLLGISVLFVAGISTAAAAPPSKLDVRLDHPVRASGPSPLSGIDRSLVGGGAADVVIRLTAAPTSKVNRGAVRSQVAKIAAQQKGVLDALQSADPSATILGKAHVALNALMVRADKGALAKLATDDRVLSINPVHDYQLALHETVPWIGATELHNRDPKIDGTGVRVAVLDTGIDYTHAAFGGPGTDVAYHEAYGNTTQSGHNRKTTNRYLGKLLYPTDKVIGGYDFVGEEWPNGPLASDPNPIDCSPAATGCTGGHGTHVADIIGGLEVGSGDPSTGGIGEGVAPGAELYAVKVCSSVSTACSGVALIEAMDFALDPNGDSDTSDHVDIINMSLGSDYGQSPDDDLSQAVENATAAGVLTVAASGNGGDKPYISGTPASAPTALSVAQTTVPSATTFAMLLSTDGSNPTNPVEAVHQPWSHEFTSDFEAVNVHPQYGDGAGGNLDGCAAFAAGSLTDKVVLVDRGACTFSLKISNIAAAGGKIGVIGLVAPGDPFAGGLGDCPNDLCGTIPGYMVSQSVSTAMKGADARVTFSSAGQIPIPLHMVGSSSRGPDNALNLIKPEVGAPGASVSAVVGSGTGSSPFGGTSGATPMVVGSAALLKQAYPGRTPLELKAALIDTGETGVFNKPAVFGGDLAPITRIGGGEVRVNRAVDTSAAAWEQGGSSSALSFGFHDISTAGGNEMTKTVVVKNYGDTSITYDVSSAFRFANDESNGAVSVSVPSSINVSADGETTFDVTVSIDGSALRSWSLSSGSAGANAGRLTSLEYDGYIRLDAPGEANDIHVPWQVLPRKAGDVSATETAPGEYELSNAGVGDASIGSFALVATSPQEAPSGTGDNVADVDLRYVGVRSYTGAFATDILGCESPVGLSFAASTWGRTVHADAPALFEFDLDLNQDGTPDYAVYNFDLSNSSRLGDGRNVTWAQDLATNDTGKGGNPHSQPAPPAPTAFFFTQHSTNSANTILTVCGDQLGLDEDSIGQSVDVTALAVDWYNSGTVRDSAKFTMVIGGDRYGASFANAGPFSPLGTVVDAGGTDTLTVADNGEEGTNPTESGLLLLLDGSLLGPGGSPEDNAAIVINPSAP